jgi:hypothetical protein
MNRRIFFRNGALSALALSLPGLSLSLLSPENVGHWLRRFAAGTNVERRRLPDADEPGLRPVLETLEAQLGQRGYCRESDAVYFPAGNDQLFFYPLWLRRSAARLTDMVVPVLARQSDRSWQTVIILTGYQVEALARAAAALAEAGQPVGDLLLPARRMQASGGGYESRSGRVEIVTRIREGRPVTAIAVYDGQRAVYEAGFPSRHGLTAQAVTA